MVILFPSFIFPRGNVVEDEGLALFKCRYSLLVRGTQKRHDPRAGSIKRTLNRCARRLFVSAAAEREGAGKWLVIGMNGKCIEPWLSDLIRPSLS
jgi:hypothetical protein